MVALLGTLGGSSPGGSLWTDNLVNQNNTNGNGVPGTKSVYVNRDGFDLVWVQGLLQNQMASVEGDINSIEANANLSDTEKMYSMQMALNTWSAISTLRTNLLKTVSDTLASIVRNCAA